jgi:uncharacterized protein YeaO (DUF488 family)
LAIRVVRLGSPRDEDEGVRIGTVRRPPRGVPKADFARRDFYDAWLPQLSPSPELLRQAKNATGSAAGWQEFARKFRQELSSSETQKIIELLVTLSRQTNFSIGCYCEDEARCHRSILKAVLQEKGATILERAR